MTILSRDDLLALAEPRPGPAVSLYLPTHRAGAETAQDPVRFKNLLAEAGRRLAALGLRRRQADGLLEPGLRLLNDEIFWIHQNLGLAVFLAPGFERHLCLPAPLPELAAAGERFHLKPLLPLLFEDGRFYVLALAENQVRLIRCSRHTAEAMPMPGVPQSIDEALALDDAEKQLLSHVTTAGGPAVFHGHAALSDLAKDRLLRYFRAVDRGVCALLQDETAPVVLAGVDYFFPIYRQASSLACLLAHGIAGNPEHRRDDELAAHGWEIAEPVLQAHRADAEERYRQRIASGGAASSAVADVVVAALHGRVETLFVVPDAAVWGTYDAATGRIDVHPEPAPGDADLLDLAAVHTCLNRGAVYTAPEDAGVIAAVLRW